MSHVIRLSTNSMSLILTYEEPWSTLCKLNICRQLHIGRFVDAHQTMHVSDDLQISPDSDEDTDTINILISVSASGCTVDR